MADSQLSQASLTAVQVEALVVMKIVKHCASTFPTTATGSIVGMDVKGTLEITNSFPFPTADVAASDHPNDHLAASNAAAAAPRSKSNIAYQTEMIKYLREVNVDANNVGWYTSANMGNFINSSLIENQYFHQKEVNERTVALVYDVSRSSQGALSLRAFRISPQFMVAYKEGKFTAENMLKTKFTYKDILVELPLVIHNSHLLTSFLHQLPSQPSGDELETPSCLADIDVKLSDKQAPLYPNLESLDLSIDPFLEKSCDLLLESIESHYTELNNFQYYQRQHAREQTKITAWKTKRAAENVGKAPADQKPEDEWQRLFKLPQEPSRLEGMLNARQVDQYSRQIDGFTAAISSKMFAIKSNLLPDAE